MSAEKMNGKDQSGASVGIVAHASEHAGITGIYHCICRGYMDKFRDEYLALWPRL